MWMDAIGRGYIGASRGLVGLIVEDVDWNISSCWRVKLRGWTRLDVHVNLILFCSINLNLSDSVGSVFGFQCYQK